MTSMRVSLCQMTVVKSKQANIIKAVSMIAAAAQRGATVAVLPECFNCPYGTKYFDEYSEEIRCGYPTFDAISQAAKLHKIWVIAGSIPEKSDGKLYNSSMIFNAEGDLLHVQRKVHLFRIDTETVRVDEGEVLTAGDSVASVDMFNGIKFGVGICFDVRYPLLAHKLSSEGTSFLVYPGAFNMVTGPLHWKLMAQARAIDNQQFVLMCSPARDDTAEYIAWGHSLIVNPLGNVIAEADEKECYIDADLDFGLIEITRKQLPIMSGVRRDLYSLNWK